MSGMSSTLRFHGLIMTHRYLSDENVVPNLQCYEILPSVEDELHLPDHRSDGAWPFKPSSSTSAPPDSLVVVSQQDSSQGNDNILQMHLECGRTVGNAGSPSASGTDSDALCGIQTVPSSVDLGGPTQESRHTTSSIDKHAADSFNLTPSAPKLAPTWQVPASLLDLILQHRETYKRLRESHSDGPAEAESMFNFDIHCDCDAHLVPRWYVEE